MTNYLKHSFDWGNPEVNWIYEDLPQWSAMCLSVFLKYVPLKENLKVLDLGTGTGIPSLELAQRLGSSSTVYAVDSWKDSLDKAKLKAELMGLSNLKFSVSPGDSLPFDDSCFDMVTANLLINNLENCKEILTECYRVTKYSGCIAIATNLRGQMSEFYNIFEVVLKKLNKTESIDKFKSHIKQRETIESLKELLEEVGFKIKRIETEENCFRFLDGTAMLNHFIIKEAFLDEWRRILKADEEVEVFTLLESQLNEFASEKGELRLTIPLAYIEAEKN